jgi:hypothetical protein
MHEPARDAGERKGSSPQDRTDKHESNPLHNDSFRNRNPASAPVRSLKAVAACMPRIVPEFPDAGILHQEAAAHLKTADIESRIV